MFTFYNEAMEGVFHEIAAVFRPKQFLYISFVFGEEPTRFHRRLAVGHHCAIHSADVRCQCLVSAADGTAIKLNYFGF